MTTLNQLDKLKHQLDASRPLNPHRVRRLHEDYRVRLTYHSIALEGNTLSETETAVLLEQGLTAQGKPLKHHLEAEDYALAFDHVEFLTTSYNRASDRDLRDIHTLVCKRSGSDSVGRYRTTNRVTAASDAAAPVRYPDAMLVPELMSKFDFSLSIAPTLSLSTSPAKQHPVDLAAEVHARLMAIHPFTDGNGHTARLFMNLLLLRAGYSVAIIEAGDRSVYFDALLSWRSGNDQPLKAIVRDAVADSLGEMLSLSLL